MKVGGQAVIEGVMMKNRDLWSVAVRDPMGVIHVKKERLRPLPKILKIPFIRGVNALYQSLALGVKAINYSASKALDETEEKPMSSLTITLTMVFAFVMGIGIFLFLPLYITKLIAAVLPPIGESSFLFNIADGVLRVGFFIVYIFIISQWKDMRRIFEYHGAEHKVIFAFEAGTDMEISSIQKFGTYHPRCGTSFLFIVMLMSILVFSVIPKTWAFSWKFGSRVVLIPMIAGLSYEILRYSAKSTANPLIKFLIQPGLLLQRITTKEPDDSQIEVALRALTEVVPALKPEMEKVS
ncbi:MAG: DUF1385 domain-containing protein [Candidatus Magnetominusculus sp. LBB02]|nr:DUF1385 domain-containing protein [Candidatus Magnetominusculus sp. LBB02]